MQEQFCGYAAFACVYLSEAHAKDQWPVGPIISDTNAATNLQDRIKQANHMVKKTGLDIPVLIDTMDDLFGTAYAAWPMRYYVVGTNGKILWVAEPDEVSRLFEPAPLKDWLENYFDIIAESDDESDCESDSESDCENDCESDVGVAKDDTKQVAPACETVTTTHIQHDISNTYTNAKYQVLRTSIINP